MAEISASFCDEQFAPCLDAFEANFSEDGELGAACAIYRDGRCVLDVWGGISEPLTRTPWAADTVVPVFSVTKGVAALCILTLVERGLLELDSPVSRYWPDFRAEGKGAVSVREALGHRAGVPAISGQVTLEDLSDPIGMAARLAAEKPLFEPGKAHAYHAITIGWITSELVRRLTGLSLGKWFRANLAEPLGLNIQIGRILSDRSPIGLVEVRLDDDTPAIDPMATAARPISLNGLIEPTMSGLAKFFNDPTVHKLELAGANGLADARSLARLYQAVLGSPSDQTMALRQTLVDACRTVSEGEQWGTGLPGPTWGAGLMLPWSVQPMLGQGSFGHDGAGGSLAFAHPPSGISFAYVRNRAGPPGVVDPMVYRIVRALAEVLNLKVKGPDF